MNDNLFSYSMERSIVQNVLLIFRHHIHTKVGEVKSPEEEDNGWPCLPGNKEGGESRDKVVGTDPCQKIFLMPLFYHQSTFHLDHILWPLRQVISLLVLNNRKFSLLIINGMGKIRSNENMCIYYSWISICSQLFIYIAPDTDIYLQR